MTRSMKKRSRRTKRRRKSRKTRRRRGGWGKKKTQPDTYKHEAELARAQELRHHPKFFSTMNKMSQVRGQGSRAMKKVFDENYGDTDYKYTDFSNLGLYRDELNYRSKKTDNYNKHADETDMLSTRDVYLGGKKKKRKRKRKKRMTKKR